MTVRVALAMAAALVAFPAVALAVDYRVMGEDERAISLIEGAVKTDSDGHKETVFYFGFSQPVGSSGTTQIISATILFDCEGVRYKVGETSSFTAEMAAVGKTDGRYSWRDIVADSPFGRAWSYACKGTALPKADNGEVKKVVAGYLARRAALAPPASAPAPAPAAEPPLPSPPVDAPAGPSS